MKAWMIKTPTGRLLKWSIRPSKTMCITDAWGKDKSAWRKDRKFGFRCVRVTIKEDK